MKKFEHSITAMSTQIDLKFWGDLGTVEGQELAQKALSEFSRIAKTYTRFSKDSELSRLNRSGGKECKLSEEFIFLLNKLFEIAEFSGGVFDPTIIDLLEMHGYKSSFSVNEIQKSRRSIKEIKKYTQDRPSWREVRLSGDEVVLQKGQRIDLGGIGKGYALDCAAKVLKDAGVKDFLISAGGDCIALGYNLEGDYGRGFKKMHRNKKVLPNASHTNHTDQSNHKNHTDHTDHTYYKNQINQTKSNIVQTSPTNKQKWTVGLLTKVEGKYRKLGEIQLDPSGQALASSGSWARTVGQFHHILDPTSGLSETNSLQSFVLADSAIDADGLSTALFLAGPDLIDQIAGRYGAESLLVTHDKKIFASDGFPELGV